MPRKRQPATGHLLCALALSGAGAAVGAQDDPPPVATTAPGAPAEADARPPDAALVAVPEAQPAPTPQWPIEGALGPVVHVNAEFSGSASQKVSVIPGFYLRYGRYSLSNTGAFVNRHRDDVFQGLGADLHLSDTVRTHAGLRLDRGRPASEAEALHGLQGQRSTVRLRLATTWVPGTRHVLEGWRFTAAATTDLLGRGGGQTLDVAVGRDNIVGERLVWSYSAGLAAGSAAYMQRQHGVTPEESQHTGYPVYTPSAGLRDLTLSTGWRIDIDPQWVAFWGVSGGRLLGPALGV